MFDLLFSTTTLMTLVLVQPLLGDRPTSDDLCPREALVTQGSRMLQEDPDNLVPSTLELLHRKVPPNLLENNQTAGTCPCSSRTCIPICLHSSIEKFKMLRWLNTTSWANADPLLDPNFLPTDQNITLHLFRRRPCPGMLLSSGNFRIKQFDMRILSNGSLSPGPHQPPITIKDYCFDIDNYVFYLKCWTQDNWSAQVRKDQLVERIFEFFTVACCLAIFLVYTITPEFKNLHGLIMRSYIASFGLLHITELALSFMNEATPMGARNDCMSFGFFLYTMHMTNIFWLNVMAIDIWWTFRRFTRRQGMKKQIFIYSIYAWGCPLVITCFAIFCAYVPSIPESFIKPTNGGLFCLFSDFSTVSYYHGPKAIMLIINISLFIATAKKIRENERSIASQLNEGDSKRHANGKKRFYTYLKLFILMAVDSIIGLCMVIYFYKVTDSDGIKLALEIAQLFDTIQERYEKQRNNIAPYSAIQIGLTSFRRVRGENKYIAEPFRFYLLSRSLLHGKNQNFVWEKTSLSFLRVHNFDWNALVYGGISYLNETELLQMREHLKTNDYMSNMGPFCTMDEENKLQKSMIIVSDWLRESPPSEKSLEIDCDDFLQLCCLQRQLRKSFRSIWTEHKDLRIFVLKIDPETRKFLEEMDENLFEDQLLEYTLGFTKVFQILREIKKPIVGHNLLLDLMFMYKQFYRALPKNYETFKSDIHEIFPVVYDTKLLSYEMRKILDPKGEGGGGMEKKKEEKTKSSNVLGELYQYFKKGKGTVLTWNSPKIEFSDGLIPDTEAFHDAGWDSYYTGYCFIKIAHVFASQSQGKGSLGTRELTHIEMMTSLKDFVNCVNLIRADLSHLRLEGPDPPSRRPPWLNIQVLQSKSISKDEVLVALSPYDRCDIKLYSSKSVLVAAPNWRTARDILQHFQQSKDYKAAPFSFIRHSPAVKSILWGTLVISGSVLAMLIHRAVERPSVT